MSETVVLDACCLINLTAADALDTWLGELGLCWLLPEAVLREAMFLRGGGGDAGEAEGFHATEAGHDRLVLDAQIASRLLTVVQPDGDAELAAFVDLARELDDGEAMALAIAKCRGWRLATDDRKAIRLAGDAGVPILTTPTLVKRWVDQLGPSTADVRAALTAIRNRARFLPSGRDPLCDWWMAQLRPKPQQGP